jgi:hypothetical protein
MKLAVIFFILLSAGVLASPIPVTGTKNPKEFYAGWEKRHFKKIHPFNPIFWNGSHPIGHVKRDENDNEQVTITPHFNRDYIDPQAMKESKRTLPFDNEIQ